ncbi:MAG: VCBS repeat-containing protein, partial [Ignavibacteriae bacterium]|nr:VCBS repeat-containing protein [Ignavibacteriota bacterium]
MGASGVIIALLLVGLTAGSAFSQPFIREVYGIPVQSGAEAVEHPFTGGLYNPMHQFVDIDGDADIDLFLFDFNDLSMMFFKNVGSQQNPAFRFETPPFIIPFTQSWFRFADIDGDNKLDFLGTGDSANSVAIYRNVGTPQLPVFTLMTSLLRDSANSIVRADAYSIAALADMDGDGDPDYFSLNSGNGTINYYENIGNTTNFVLAFRTDRYQGIQICVGCRPETPPMGTDDPFLHGNGTMHFGDIDADNDFDMLYGDLFDAGLFFFRNIGTPTNPILDSVSARFPPANPVLTGGFNQPTLVDIDGDGDVDLFVSVLPPLQRVDNFRFYQNVGTPSA